MNQQTPSPDFGPGLSLDEVVGMAAGDILGAMLPNSAVFSAIEQAAALMYQRGMADYHLQEIWADGHTIWHGNLHDDPVIVTPTGQAFGTRR